MSEPPRIVSWLAHGIASSLDAFFLNRFEQQRAEYWQTLYSTVVSNFVYILLSLVVILFIFSSIINYYSYAEHEGPISNFMLRK